MNIEALMNDFVRVIGTPSFVIPDGGGQYKYYNTAGIGIPFTRVSELTRKIRACYEEYGLFHPLTGLLSDIILSGCRKSVAELIEAEANEIALTQNATEAIQGIIWGLDFKEGDTILMGKREHPSLHLLNRNIERLGASVVKVDTEISPYEQELPEKVAFAAFSVVAYLSGVRLHQDWITFLKEKEIPWLADATQAVGQVKISVKELQCDFLVASGHKWLHGPVGTGFVYINEASGKLLYFYPRAWKSVEYREGTIHDRKNAIRFEKATMDLAPLAGLAVAASWANSKEWAQITEKRCKLADVFSGELQNVDGITVIHDTVGMIGIEGAKGRFNAFDLSDQCYKKGQWIIKAMDLAEFPNPALRLSFSVNNVVEDTYELVNYLEGILR